MKNFNYLGIIINEHMDWKNHIINISTKISKVIGTLKRLKHYLSTQTKLYIYNALITPHLNYGILAWGHESSRLSKLQKAAIRTITGKRYNAHTDPLFKEIKVLKVNDIFTLQQYKFFTSI